MTKIALVAHTSQDDIVMYDLHPLCKDMERVKSADILPLITKTSAAEPLRFNRESYHIEYYDFHSENWMPYVSDILDIGFILK